MTTFQSTLNQVQTFGQTKSEWEEFFQSEMNEHQAVAQKVQEQMFEDFYKLCQVCLTAIQKGNKIMFFGNGGSAADSQHLATELTVRYKEDRLPIAAIALTTDTSALTAIGNDYDFTHLFSRQIQALGQPGDVCIGITTSGKSPNVIKALTTAKAMGLVPAALSGKDGGDLKGIADPLIIIPSNTTSRIQEMHITLGQMLCGALEKALGLVA